MTTRRRAAIRCAGLVSAVAALVLGPAVAAFAHPLGNFTINHYSGLVLTPDGIEDLAVIDAAEIPTLEEQHSVDADADGQVSAAERAAFAQTHCAGYQRDLAIAVDGKRLSWTLGSASYSYRPGAAGLQISRLECQLSVHVNLRSQSTISFEDHYLSDRIGWREITARGQGIAIADPPVPTTSVSDELRAYPNALLSSPLNQRSVELSATPGTSTSSGALPAIDEPSWVSRTVGRWGDALNGLVGRQNLTVGVGLLAVGLALLLGASHAALPGHGKTLMAAYMVGTRGTTRDAVWIGTTVTFAHTAGVLVLGAVISASTTFAGEHALSMLGVVSGLLVAVVGVSLLRAATRHRLAGPHHGHGHEHLPVDSGGPRNHEHAHPHGHEHPHSHEVEQHGDHQHGDHQHGDHQHIAGQVMVLERPGAEVAGRTGPEPGTGFKRITLVGMGVAGGLVPSPSALVVLLGAIALGRTMFGVVLVLAYGLGMAATLTTVGFLVARAPRRFGGLRRLSGGRFAVRLTAIAPVATATLVLVVGLALAARSATGIA